MLNWLWNGNDVTEDVIPESAVGFVYLIEHIPSGKYYIGKKSLIYNLKKKLGKKEKALYEGKGRPPTFKRVLK